MACVETAIQISNHKSLVEPFMSDDAAASPPPALQQVHASAPVASAPVASAPAASAPASESAPPHHTLKPEPPTTLEKTPLAEKLTDPPSPTDDVATGQ